MTDVFKYSVVCADTGICDIDQNKGEARNAGIPNGELCESAEECEVNCKSSFESICEAYSRHSVASTLTDVVAIRLNGMDVDLGGSYDLTDATGSADFIAAAKAKVNFGSVFLVSGSFAAGTTTVNIFTDSFVTSAELVSAGSADVELTLNEGNYIHVYSTSTPSGDASLTDLAWTTGTAATFNGAPGVGIPAATANYYGDYDNYFAETTESGSYQLVITDDSGCTDTSNATVDTCA